MRCKIEKAEILPLPTLAYNESIISGILDILQNITQLLGFTNDIIRNKVIILKDDLLIVRNAT